MELNEQKIKNPLEKYKNLILFFFLSLIAFLILLLNSQTFTVSYQQIKAIPAIYVIIIIIMVLLFWLLDAILLHYPIQDPELKFKDSLMINFAGSFFSAITPYATGSQPSRLYYLHKNNVSIEKSVSGLLFKAFTYQAVLVFLGMISLVTGKNIIIKMDNYRIVLTLGFIYNLALFLISFLIAKSKKVNTLIIQAVNSIGSKSKRKTLFTINKAQLIDSIENFTKEMNYVLKRKRVIIPMFVITILKLLIYNSIPIIILWGLGFDVKSNIVELLSLSALINIVITIIPTPGGVVAAEGAFILLFGLVYVGAEKDLYAVMLMWRFFTHYLLIIIGFFSMMYLQTKNTKKNKKKGM